MFLFVSVSTNTTIFTLNFTLPLNYSYNATSNNVADSDFTKSGWTRPQKAAFSMGIIIITGVLVAVAVYLYKKSKSGKGIINNPDDDVEMS